MSYIEHLEKEEILNYIEVVDTDALAHALRNTSKKVPGFSGRNRSVPRQMVTVPIVSLSKTHGRDGDKIRGILNEIIENRNEEAYELLDLKYSDIKKMIEGDNQQELIELTFKFAQKTSVLFSSYISSMGKKDEVDYKLIKGIEEQLWTFFQNREKEERELIDKAVNKCKEEFEIKEQSFHNEHDKVRKRAKELKDELKDAEEQIREKSKKNEFLLNEVSKAQKENETLNNDNDQLANRLKAVTAELKEIKMKVQELNFNELVTIEDLNTILSEKKDDERIFATRFFKYIKDAEDESTQKLDSLWDQWLDYERTLVGDYLTKLRIKDISSDKIEKLEEVLYLTEMRSCIIQILQAMGYKILENKIIDRLY